MLWNLRMDNTDAHKTKYKEERLYMSTNQNLMQHMWELIDRIKAADVAYYRDDNPTMTDREYDLLVDELKELEATIGLVLSGSPTQTVSGEILKELTPVRHTKPMLSADKTKSVDEMLQFANGRPVVLSWKLDGLTLVLRYEGGEFKQAITRGREGIIDEDVTHTVRTFMDVPMCIPCTDKFEVRGEGVISWAHFEKINLSLSEPYSHPRNLAAGSVRMLDARESGKRYLEFFAFDLISDSIEEHSKAAQLQFLAENGFDVVPYQNELCWCYPIMDELHLGTFLLLVKEGVLSLPFNEVDSVDYELFCLEDACLCDAASINLLIADWYRFDSDLDLPLDNFLVQLYNFLGHTTSSPIPYPAHKMAKKWHRKADDTEMKRCYNNTVNQWACSKGPLLLVTETTGSAGGGTS